MLAYSRLGRSHRLLLALLLLVAVSGTLVLDTVPPYVLPSLAQRVQTFVTIALGIFIEAVPFLLAGSLAAGFVSVYLNPDALARLVPRTPLLAVGAGAVLGLAFPVCECGVVPLTRRLYQKGLPVPMGVSFMLAAPVINPIVIVSTYTAFGWGPVFLGRLGLSFLIAVTVGYLFGLAPSQEVLRPQILSDGPSHEHDLLGEHEPLSRRQRAWSALAAAGDDFLDMARYLVIGSFLTAFIQTVVPQGTLLSIGRGPLSSVIAMLLLAFALSVCSTVDAFLALAFVSTFTTGSILGFLVFGPMVDIKSTLMFLSLFRRRAVVYLILLAFTMAAVAAVFANLNLAW